MKKFLLFTTLALLFFRRAFTVEIFQDDFYLFNLSRAGNFFYPLKPYGFYRPIGIEAFYWFADQLNKLALTRIIVFGVFGLGLVFLQKTVYLLTKNSRLATLTSIIYLFSFTHVFQLYWLATFQEIAMMTCSIIATYYFLSNRYLASAVSFTLALFSREQAMLLPVALGVVTSKFKQLSLLGLMALPFALIYVVNYPTVAVRPEYSPVLNPKLIANNLTWYTLWSAGLPNFFPDYLFSLTSLPTNYFWQAISSNHAWPYLITWDGYIIILIFSILKIRSRQLLKIAIICAGLYLIYILPISVIVHKWMVRLTVPVIFFSFFIAYVIDKSPRMLGIITLTLYILFNYLAIPIHENTSTYMYESQITSRTKQYLQNLNPKPGTTFYFSDDRKILSGWEGSQKLKLTLFDQHFLEYWYPNQKLQAVYEFEATPPKDAITIKSELLL